MRKVIFSMMVLFQFCSYGFASDSNSDEPKFFASTLHETSDGVKREELQLDRIKCFGESSVTPVSCGNDPDGKITGRCEARGDFLMKDGRRFYGIIGYSASKDITRPWCKKVLPGLDCGQSLADQYNERVTIRASREKLEGVLSSLKCDPQGSASQSGSNENADASVSGEAI